MGIKQSIVIKNEFSVPTADGGSRGGTPGAYVERYMARDNAVENLAPIKLMNEHDYIERYMARESATESLPDVPSIKKSFESSDGLGGIAFGNGDVSMSSEKVHITSNVIQAAFDQGKTVFKTVLSFDEEYLKKYNLVDPTFELVNAGDYRGNLDQLKLRRAIMDGIDRISPHFDDLYWIGVIQVDTKHVHCHLSMVDLGEGVLVQNGEQRGKLNEADKRALRRGVDMSLDSSKHIQHMASNVQYDRRNARCFIKKHTHNMMATRGLPQFLIACLPEDKNLWRAESNAQIMRKSNSIVEEYVNEVLNLPGSGKQEALQSIERYATSRMDREGLSLDEYRQLINDGYNRVVIDCMNGVYEVLKQIPDEEFVIETPMLDAMSMDYEDMAAEAATDPMIEFGFKLRSYSSRLKHHKKERDRFHEARVEYESSTNASESSKVLYDFYKLEEDYQTRCMAKYQHFLNFLPPTEKWEDDLEELFKLRKREFNMRLMLRDNRFAKMDAQTAEDYGLRMYELRGGSRVATEPEILERIYETMRDETNEFRNNLAYRMAEDGYVIEMNDEDDDFPYVRKQDKVIYSFDDVKALDLHHLGFDFPFGAPISVNNLDNFIEMAERRSEAYKAAASYLKNTGQSRYLKEFPVSDIEAMIDLAEQLKINPSLPSKRNSSSGDRHRRTTMSLDQDYNEAMSNSVKTIAHSMADLDI